MPEGDILRRTARTLDAAFAGERLVRAELRWPSAATVDLVGRTVVGVEAYGKHLFLRVDDGRTLHTHLRMEGSWRLARTGTASAHGQGDFVRAVLATSTWTAVGNRLGMLEVMPTVQEIDVTGRLGPDVLADDFPGAGLARALNRFRERGATPVGETLLDQSVVAGIGTIYMAESLFARRIWPWTPTGDVTDPASLLMTARTLMQRSVESDTPSATGEQRRGTTTWVHGRVGQPCRRCGTPITVGQVRPPPMERPAFYCPTCQRG
ncbi:Fpg/Nei family DNA glycosylase [Actinotalea subterranea]|uniref:Fpg/Nei family DNA glycosylase n=1 Tax=Actinotalea subterranea TaxID=2607497 RepID=UPI0011EC10C9|nr:DNA-formamidopyrimidine glycosylase family protein [Actinotalea subterranea]